MREAMIVGALLLGALNLRCQAAPHFDLALVKGEPQAPVRLRAPYVATYRSGGFQLDYVAARHEFATDRPTMTMVRTLFSTSKPDFVIIEGLQASRGISPKSFVEYARRRCGSPACPEGEAAYTVLLSARRGIPFQGGEPDEEDVTAALAAQGYSAQDWLAYDFFRNAGWRKDQPGFASDQLQSLFEQIKARPQHGAAKDYRLSDFESWYQKATGKPFSLAAVDVSRDEAPDSDGTRIQRISAAVDALRNLSEMKVLASAAEKHHHVLIVYGSGHYDAEREFLENALGVPSLKRSPLGADAHD